VAQTLDPAREVLAAEPRVRLVAHTERPFDLAVASARTCYASEFVFVGRLDRKGERTRMTLEDALPQHREALAEVGRLDTPHERRIALVEQMRPQAPTPDVAAALDSFALLALERSRSNARIAHDIYEAGHHTPFQHPTFVFALEGVSRNLVESFLHNHTFYNSEQQSQRYVEMRRAEVHVPASVRGSPLALAAYEGAVRSAWDAYDRLRERLVAGNLRVMAAIGRVKGQSEREVRKEAEKKSQEMARYVIPIAAATQLYHTVSGIVLLRYARMCASSGVAAEASRVVEQMVEEVRRVDPAFVEQVREQVRPEGETLEAQLSEPARPRAPAAPPTETLSVLVHATPDAERLVADAVREVTGSTLPHDELLRRVLDPAGNGVWADTLNTWDHSPVLRTLRHVHYTFRKRLSLTAFAQDQRHRTTPASRPLLAQCLTEAPDVHVPDVIAADAEARADYDQAVAAAWSAIGRLRQMGIPEQDLCYLLPNATHVHFTQSGDLLSLIHKWRLRLCFNAQKEIFEASLAELRQAQAVHPGLTRWLGPPCVFVAARQPPELQDSVAACCPEGPRWCGVKVWLGFDAQAGRPKRPY
jgi:thymidylate synthase ThyX